MTNTSSLDGYDALHKDCGWVHLTGWSTTTLTGSDRQKFLNNFCTNDVKRLQPGEACEAFFCNVKGRIIGHGLVACGADELIVIGPPGQGESLAAHLDRYVIREDVTVRDTTNERAVVLMSGNHAAEERFRVLCSSNSVQIFPWNLAGAEFGGVAALSSEALPGFMAALRTACIAESTYKACDVRRVEFGTPLFGIDFNEHNFPQEVRRDTQAISFTKGCYLGQETVARIDALGHVNQQLAGIRFVGHEVPPPGAELTVDATVVGHITSAVFSPQLDSPLALAMTRREHSTVGKRMQSPVGECEVIALPFSGSTTNS